MKKIIAFAITFILVISMVGCSKNDNKGSITFYGEATKESTEPASKESFALTEEQAVKLQNIIGNHCDEWNDNVITDRLAYYFDGYFELGSENPKYYFTYEHNGIYQDDAFVELTTDEMQYSLGAMRYGTYPLCISAAKALSLITALRSAWTKSKTTTISGNTHWGERKV